MLKASDLYVPTTEIEIKFETYRFYLTCIRKFLYLRYKNWKTFGSMCNNNVSNLKTLKTFDRDWIKRWMRISWNTEFLLSSGINDAELIRIKNQWSPIQSYYAMYGGCEAISYILDNQKANSHQKAINKITNFFVQCGLSPWRFAFIGARGKDKNSHMPVNFPNNISIPSNLSRTGVLPIQMIARCLKAEHNHRIDNLFVKRPKLYKYNFNPGYTSILHFFYRLRIKSNYKDVDIFISEAPSTNILSFYTSLTFITYWFLLYMEIILMKKCNKQFLIDLIEEYLIINPGAELLRKRFNFYNTLKKSLTK